MKCVWSIVIQALEQDLNLPMHKKKLSGKAVWQCKSNCFLSRMNWEKRKAHQKTLMTAEKTDLAAINKNIEKIGGLKIEMAKIKAKNHLDLRAQLNRRTTP